MQLWYAKLQEACCDYNMPTRLVLVRDNIMTQIASSWHGFCAKYGCVEESIVQQATVLRGMQGRKETVRLIVLREKKPSLVRHRLTRVQSGCSIFTLDVVAEGQIQKIHLELIDLHVLSVSRACILRRVRNYPLVGAYACMFRPQEILLIISEFVLTSST